MILSYLFGCRHEHHTWPRTIRGSRPKPEAAMVTGTYITCTDCGKEMPYDLEEMRVLTARQQRRALAALAVGVLVLALLGCGAIAKPKRSSLIYSKGTIYAVPVGLQLCPANKICI